MVTPIAFNQGGVASIRSAANQAKPMNTMILPTRFSGRARQDASPHPSNEAPTSSVRTGPGSVGRPRGWCTASQTAPGQSTAIAASTLSLAARRAGQLTATSPSTAARPKNPTRPAYRMAISVMPCRLNDRAQAPGCRSRKTQAWAVTAVLPIVGYNRAPASRKEYVMRYAPTRTLLTRRCRSPWIAVAAIASAVLIAACGSASKPHTATGSSGAAQAIKYADCMRSHGVTNFPDPSGGSGAQLPQGSSPALQAAVQACQALQPSAEGSSHATAGEKATMLHLSQCMRAHGVSGFPDPISSLPPNPRFSSVFGTPGALIGIPIAIDTQSPAFKEAAKVCGLPGP